MGAPFIVKYQPSKAADIPQPSVSQLRDFILAFKKQKKKAALLYGPAGSGKTSAVHALAKELGLEILEVNASDVRNADGIQSSVGIASQQMSLFSKGKLILVDEVDGLSGQKDRGGPAAIASIIADSKFPVVLTANDPWDSKFSGIRSKSVLIEFAALDHAVVTTVLKNICTLEGITYDELTLKTLARRSGGDLRSAITDLQTLVKDNTLTKESLDTLGDRDREESMFNALTKVLKGSDPALAVGAFDNVNEDLDGAFLWVDENLPKEYTNPKDLARAYEALAKADVYRGRIKRRQHWHFLVYVNTLLSAGVSVAKDAKYPGFIKYGPTGRILKIWQANMKYQKRKAIAQKVALATHSSTKRTIQELPYLQALFKKNHPSAAVIADECDLDPEEVEWLAR
jgi:replication factor C large subunit